MKFEPVTLGCLVEQFGGSLQPLTGCSSQSLNHKTLEGFASLDCAGPQNLAFFVNLKLLDKLVLTQASVILAPNKSREALIQALSHKDQLSGLQALWFVDDPYLSYAKIQQWWVACSEAAVQPGVHPSAQVHASASMHPSVHIGPNAVVQPHAKLAAGVVVGAGAIVGKAVEVDENTLIHANVVLYHECVVGKNCILHSGSVIGADGFGFANEAGQWVKIPQTGRVVLADQVEVGANTTIDRGALDDTLIGFGVKLDNQIMVAHNSTIGEHTAIAGCAGMAGSTRIGARCTIGGAAMLLGHLSIPDGTHISGASAVMSSIKEAGSYTGIFPIDSHKAWERTAASLKQIAQLRQRIRALERGFQLNQSPEKS